MSTEGSDSITSSQIRRFGLYRTIDAKTEEFLRLSRKRQIRQGCACAAISTTITVTVVVSVVLIYEYSMVSESNSRTTLTPKWLSLLNTSVDNLPFEVKLDKTNIGLDPATIKFLPLILKTLKKHKYFDKMIDETSSQNPLDDKIEPTDDNINKNIFKDATNWMRVPTSRLYTIEYKTSPIVYFKSPTRNVDYFTKVRKIRDYQRIMNYVDKMISERVTLGSTVPMKNIYKHKNIITTDYTTPMTKTLNYGIYTVDEKTKNPKITSSKDKPNCSCPKRMNELLRKLINSLQKLLPNFTDMPDKSTQVTKPSKNSNAKLISELPQTIVYKLQPESSTKSSRLITPNIVAVSSRPYRTKATTTSLPKLDYTLNAIIALLKPDLLKKDKKSNNLLSIKTTTTKNYVEGTERDHMLENITEAMKETSAAKLSNTATTIRDYILSSNSEKTAQTFFNYPKKYEDNIKTVPSYVNINNDKTLFEHDLEFVKRKIISNMKGQKTNKVEDINKFSYNHYDKKSNNLPRKITDMGVSSTIATTDTTDLNWELREKTKAFCTEEPVTSSTSADGKTDLHTESLTNQGVTEINKMDQTPKTEDITIEEEIEKTSPDDIAVEENLKSLENIIRTLNNTDIYNKTTTEVSELYEWELVKIEDNDDKDDIFKKSMIPEDKATYLEFQRNDWKQDEHQDYDNNINHYLFE